MPPDLDKLQGNWNITALEIEGRPMPSTGSRIIIAGRHRLRRVATAAGSDRALETLERRPAEEAAQPQNPLR